MPALLVSVILCLVSTQALAQVYKWVDANGRVHYGDGAASDPAASTALELDQTNVADPYTAPSSAAPEIALYSTRWCGVCKRAKAFLDRRGVPYQEYDIEANQTAYREFRRLGGRGVPLVVVGSERLQGFNQARLERALDAAGY